MVQIIATFNIPFVQILNEKGKLVNELPDFARDHNLLIELYRVMVCTRAFDKKAIALQRTGRIGTYAPLHGQEAISTAIGNSMRPEDLLVPYYRDYAAQLQRGVKMSEILAYWGGDERGSDFACQSEDLPISVPIATQCLHAVGVAFACKYRQQKRVVVACIGDGGTSEGDFYEALNAAGAWHLPIVFVINNNQWAISMPRSQQTAAQTLAQKAVAAGFDGVQVDGNDILACRLEVAKAIERARNECTPTLIEAITYRLCNHTTADDASRYQSTLEVTGAQLKEPIIRFKSYLEQEGIWDEAQEKALLDEANILAQSAADEFLNTPPQSISSAFDYHYQDLPNYLIEQRALAMEEVSHA